MIISALSLSLSLSLVSLSVSLFFNREIVASTRGLWRRLQRQRDAEVELRHVRSHTRVSGNELADWLADVGREEGGPVSAVCAQAVGCGAGSLQNQTL